MAEISAKKKTQGKKIIKPKVQALHQHPLLLALDAQDLAGPALVLTGYGDDLVALLYFEFSERETRRNFLKTKYCRDLGFLNVKRD